MSGNAPLFLKKILITRDLERAGALSSCIKEHGGIPIEMPVLSFQLRKAGKEAIDLLTQLHMFQWLVFTSQNGVAFFLELLERHHISQDILNNLNIAVVGKRTEMVLETFGFKAHVVPGKYVAESLLDELLVKVSPNERVLIVRGNLARTVIKEGLAANGYDVSELIVYDTVPNYAVQEELVSLLRSKELDAITFTSSSTARFFYEMVQAADWYKLVKDCPVICIGPVTARTLESIGVKNPLIPNEYTINGMIKLLISYFTLERKDKEETQ